MKIECILHRPKGTIVEMPGKTYHFAPTPDDERHLADVEIDAHIERFLSIREAYRIARTPGAPEVETDATASLRSTVSLPHVDNLPPVALGPGETLLGSSEHPATFEINGKSYALGDIVLRAFQDSGVTLENWNELSDEQRATKVDIVLDGIDSGEIVLAPPAPPPPADDHAQLVAQYKARFGKAPPSNMRVETLKAKLAAGAE